MKLELGTGQQAEEVGWGVHVGGRETSATIWTLSSYVGKAEAPGKVRLVMWGRQFSCLLIMGLGVLPGSPRPQSSGAGARWATCLGRDTAGQGHGAPPPYPLPASFFLPGGFLIWPQALGMQAAGWVRGRLEWEEGGL